MANLTISTLDVLGAAVAGVNVIAEPTDENGKRMAVYQDGHPVVATARGKTDTDGTITLDLIPQADLAPTPSYYTVWIGDRAWLIQKSAGDETLLAALIEEPTPAGSALTLSKMQDVDTTGKAAGKALVYDDDGETIVPGDVATPTDVTAAVDAEAEARQLADQALDAAKLDADGGVLVSDLDADGNRITGLPAAATPGEPVELVQMVQALIQSEGSVTEAAASHTTDPVGHTADQVAVNAARHGGLLLLGPTVDDAIRQLGRDLDRVDGWNPRRVGQVDDFFQAPPSSGQSVDGWSATTANGGTVASLSSPVGLAMGVWSASTGTSSASGLAVVGHQAQLDMGGRGHLRFRSRVPTVGTSATHDWLAWVGLGSLPGLSTDGVWIFTDPPAVADTGTAVIGVTAASATTTFDTGVPSSSGGGIGIWHWWDLLFDAGRLTVLCDGQVVAADIPVPAVTAPPSFGISKTAATGTAFESQVDWLGFEWEVTR